MVRAPFRSFAALAALLLAAGSAPADKPPFRVAFIGPLTGPLSKAAEESLLGLRIAAESDANGRKVEIVPFDDAEDPKTAAAHVFEAQKKEFSAIVAMQTSVTADSIAGRARKGRTPAILVGSAGVAVDIDPEDPVLSMVPWPVDQAINMGSFLCLHSEKSGLGLYRACLNPGIVAEDTTQGRELRDALSRNLGERQKVVGSVLVAPHGTPTKAQLQPLRDAKCDRLVLFGEPELLDHVAATVKEMGWDVPFFCGDGMLSKAAASAHDGTVRKANFLLGLPAKAVQKEDMPKEGGPRETPSEQLRNRLPAGPEGKPAVIYPRVRHGWFAGWCLVQALSIPRRANDGGLIAALRALRYTRAEERECTLFDPTGRAALTQWFVWTTGEHGPEWIKPDYFPTRDLGPLMRQKLMTDWDKVELDKETKIVWLTFGEVDEKKKDKEKKKPGERADVSRTIEEDMNALGLGTRGYEGELDPWLLEELMVRTLGKINKLFLKNYDGTFVPGVSFNIHFTATKPEHLKPSQYWKGLISGEMSWDKKKDEPTEADPGGMYSSGTAYIYARWMRYHTAIKDKRLRPGMTHTDRKFIDGTYPWGTTFEENLRSDSLRALVDGYSSWFAMTGAHEFGHGCGCGHDTESSRSIMNVVDAVGLRDTQAEWIPDHIKALETALGRYGAKTKR